jgi:inorganic pyrophosphatase
MNIDKLGAGKNPAEGEINVFIEIPQGSMIKYELDKESGVVMVDRFATTTMG